jgi:phosphatidylglycerol---prolipoprotein diacylglyceryl transferase
MSLLAAKFVLSAATNLPAWPAWSTMLPMYPLAGRYGPFLIYSFTLVMWLGIAAALALAAWRARVRPTPGWPDALLFSSVLALAGGRLVFVAAQWEYFQENTPEIFWLWRGGLSYHGALLAGLAALWLWSAWQKRSFGRYAALLAPSFVLLQAFGWSACWLDGCAYGRETSFGPLAAALPDHFGVVAVRYQTQLAGLIWSLAVFFIVWWRDGRIRDIGSDGQGRLFWLALLLLSAGRFLIAFGRGDPVPEAGRWRLDIWLDGSLSVISLVKWGQYRLRSWPSSPQQRPHPPPHKRKNEANDRSGTNQPQTR